MSEAQIETAQRGDVFYQRILIQNKSFLMHSTRSAPYSICGAVGIVAASLSLGYRLCRFSHILHMSMWVSFGFSGFLPAPKNMPVDGSATPNCH